MFSTKKSGSGKVDPEKNREERFFILLKNYLFSKKMMAAVFTAAVFCCGGFAAAQTVDININISGSDPAIVNEGGGIFNAGTVEVTDNSITNQNVTGDTTSSIFDIAGTADFNNSQFNNKGVAGNTNDQNPVVNFNGTTKFNTGSSLINEYGTVTINNETTFTGSTLQSTNGTVNIDGGQEKDNFLKDDSSFIISGGNVNIGSGEDATELEIKQKDNVTRTFSESTVAVGAQGTLYTDLDTINTIENLTVNGKVFLDGENARNVVVTDKIDDKTLGKVYVTDSNKTYSVLGNKYQEAKARDDKGSTYYDLTGDALASGNFNKLDLNLTEGNGSFTVDIIGKQMNVLKSNENKLDRLNELKDEILDAGTSANNYTGNTEIKTGTLVISNKYGNDTTHGAFTVDGFKVDSGNKLISAGTVAFNGSEAELNAKTVTFGAGDKGKIGANLWFNTKAEDGAVIAKINAETITFNNDNKFYYSGIAKLENRVDENNQKIIQYNEIQLSGNVKDGENKDLDSTTKLFSTVLTDANYNDNTVTVNAKSIKDYNNGIINEDTAQELDDMRINKDNKYSNIYDDLFDGLYNETNQSSVKDILVDLEYSLDGLGDLATFIGSMGSVFSASTASQNRYQDTRPEYESSGQNKPGQSVIADNTQAASESNSAKNSIWGSYSYTDMTGDAYGNHTGYNIYRNGLLLGKRKKINDTFSCGIVFSLADSGLNGYKNFKSDNTAVSAYEVGMTDFQFAFHMEKTFAEHWETSLFIGGGAQWVDWDRELYRVEAVDKVDGAGERSVFDSKTTGNTLTVTAYLARRIDMTKNWALRPTIGIDSAHSWLYGFQENKSGNFEGENLATNIINNSLNIDDVQYNQNTVRVGLSSSWSCADNYFGVNAAIFYGRQLDEKDYAVVKAVVYDDEGKIIRNFSNIGGHEKGYDSINIGGGTYGFLNKEKTFSINATYNALFYKRATTLNTTAGASYRY